ncbi:single-stranded DNA-binding protein [Pacificimonas flava]|uniref:Single-stranded DNA-binding protein n=1 Tax=Pacificimonas flava TaxID=1234595 RepID=M2TK57_9SPHN|nr:single-stranded DNA-binding protein [Pacificimonas flava]EMD82066.1 Single-stranded DNA-binding protein [Pacificimonas flava]MBB5280906.1 single-strand DNA-binding protein [Pacificimonas flava]
MSGSLNKVMLIGNLGQDPEFRSFANGGEVCNLRLATTRTWRDRQSGERRENTQWHSVAIFNEQLVKIARDYLKKGMKIYVEGELQTRKWQDQNGNDRYTTEVVLQNFRGELTMLDGRGGDGGSGGGYGGGYGGSSGSDFGGSGGGGGGGGGGSRPQRPTYDDDLDDDVPF